MNKNYLLIGPLPSKRSVHIGGAKVSFSLLVVFFRKKNLKVNIINIDQYSQRQFKTLRNSFYIFRKYFQYILSSDVVMMNFSQNGAKFIAPLLYVFSKLFRKKVVFRMFGGDMKDIFENYYFTRILWKSTLLKCNIVFLQTKELIQYFSSFSKNVQWLPTSRFKHKITKQTVSYNKKIVFISQIKETKGINNVLEALDELSPNYTIHLYGPILEKQYEFLHDEFDIYKGVLKLEEVLPVLSQYDILILPTFHSGEGYPGIIIEAYSLGIPVITTKWKRIPEIVEDRSTGLLIEPKSTESLIEAIKTFSNTNYIYYSQNALNKFSEFDARIINESVISKLQDL